MQAIFDLEATNQDLKPLLRDLYITSAKEIEVQGNARKAVVVHVRIHTLCSLLVCLMCPSFVADWMHQIETTPLSPFDYISTFSTMQTEEALASGDKVARPRTRSKCSSPMSCPALRIEFSVSMYIHMLPSCVMARGCIALLVQESGKAWLLQTIDPPQSVSSDTDIAAHRQTR